jgi:excisionase family DNA binding protein
VRPLTLAEAGERLGLSASTLRNQVKNGRLRATMIGKTWTVTEREIERYRRESLGTRRGFQIVEPRPLAPEEVYDLADALAPNPFGSWRPASDNPPR